MYKKEDVMPDKYGNTPLSISIEEGSIEKIRQIYNQQKTYTESLKRIAIDIMDPIIQKVYGLSRDVFFRIYSETKYQLDLVGEDTTEVINAFIE